MPGREVHVFYSKLLHPDWPIDLINDVSRKMDSTAKTKGPSHREDFHSLNPMRDDSMQVHQGDPRRYILQAEHVQLDENPALASSIEQLYTQAKYAKKAKSPYYRKMR